MLEEDKYPHVSPRPWTYHSDPCVWGKRDWIEDANGETVIQNVGWIDGPRIVAAVNAIEAMKATAGAALLTAERKPAKALKDALMVKHYGDALREIVSLESGDPFEIAAEALETDP